MQVMLAAPAGESTYVAVGSGTVTDIARFASYRSRNRFISMPTAASMDGYATSNNTLTVGGLKISVPGQAPEAIFCDLPTLGAAPRAMKAAGLGDTLAKFTSVNDLRLGHLLWGERADTWDRDEPIADRMERLAQTGLVRAGEIAAGEPKALRVPDGRADRLRPGDGRLRQLDAGRRSRTPHLALLGDARPDARRAGFVARREGRRGHGDGRRAGTRRSGT